MGIESNLEESAFKHKPPAKSKLIAITGITAFVVVAYLTYDLIKPNIAPCNSILEQTSVRLETKLNLLGSGTELKLGRQQIQELSAQAQLAGVTLKACCIVLDMTEGENQGFQECQAAVSDYQDSARQVTESVDAAIKAQKTGDEQSFDAAVSNIKETIRSGAEKAGQLNQILLTGTLRMQAVLTEGSDPIETLFDVYHAAQDIDGNRVHVNSQRTTTARYTLNAGRYFVHVTAGNASATGEFEVTPGQLTNPVIDMNAGTLRMQAVLTEGSDPIETLFDVYHAAQDIDGNRVHVNSQRTTTARFTLNAGRYFVHVTAGNASATGEYEVTPGQMTNPRFLLQTQ